MGLRACFLFLGIGQAWGGPAPVSPGSACDSAVAEIEARYAAKDPALLKVDMAGLACADSQYYRAFYYQGFGAYFLGRAADARLYLELAADLGGPWDEQILRYIWEIQGRLGDRAGQRLAYRELRRRYPHSPYLRAMREPPPEPAWRFMVANGFGYAKGGRIYQGPIYRDLLHILRLQEWGTQRLGGFATASGTVSLDGRNGPGGDAQAGLLYDFRAFSLEAALGLSNTYAQRIRIRGSQALADTGRVGHWHPEYSLIASQDFPLTGPWSAGLNGDCLDVRGSYVSAGAGAGLVCAPGAWRFGLDGREDYQDFRLEPNQCVVDSLAPDSLCAGVADAGARFRSYGSQVNLDGTRTWRFQSLGLGLKARWERSPDSAGFSRRIASAAFQHAWRPRAWVKLVQRLEGGYEYDGSARDPILKYAGTVLLYF